jgi:predicted MFS family arabinose efflux permease
LLGIIVLWTLPESPQWIASQRNQAASPNRPAPLTNSSFRLKQLFSGQLLWLTLVGIVISAIPMVGAWSASKWMIPWADQVAGASNATYKATTQGWWALGATLGSLVGAQLASWLGRKASYSLISLLTFAATYCMFNCSQPLEPGFHLVVFAQGFLGTLFFGWLALSLPELFPVKARATGSGLCYNSGRFATAAGVLLAGILFEWLGGDYPRVGTLCASVYALGIVIIWLMPDTRQHQL